jgi:copper/silver efflux system protein
MIGNLIAWSARNVLLVLIASLFAVAGGLYALGHLPLDAIPDLSDTQVIVYTEDPGQAPQVVEDQVTYPLTTAMLTVPKSKAVRGFSFFGVSFVYIIFEDGTDIYWARSRVLEYLNAATKRLPSGVTPTLGPDATGVGWVYQYAITAQNQSLAETRSTQDWALRFGLAKAEGVAEIAGVGGFVKQYNVVVDPQRMRDLGITLDKVREVIRASNTDVGGRTLELSGFEFIVRGKGYLRGIDDLSKIVLKVDNGTPVLLKDVARIELGPDERRGITELNGEGEVASGIALQRSGSNALDVIDSIKQRMAALMPSLPPGTNIVPVYDRSNLIKSAIETLKHTLLEESLIVALVCIVFLLHIRSALVAILMLPVGILMAFSAMRLLGLGANIMSLGGIAIAIGAMIDGAIVMIENAHKHLERAAPGKSRAEVLIEAAREVGPSLFFSLLVITVSFMPIFTLESQEGRLFGPLAFTKTFSMAADAILSHHSCASADDPVRARQDHPGAKESHQPGIDLGLPAADPGRSQGEDVDDPFGARSAGGQRVASWATRDGVHADAERRHIAVHADDAAGDFGDVGDPVAANAGPHHQELPRGGVRLWQSGARRHLDRPRAERNVRDRRQSQAQRSVAAGGHDRQPHRRDG